MPPTDDLLTDISGAVATVTFNRPQMRNAIGGHMIVRATEFLRQIKSDPSVRCLVFRGAGEHFSAGGDVRNFEVANAMSAAERQSNFEQRVRASSELLVCLESLNLPIVAVARGAVAGAGLSFMLAADFALASETCTFVFAHSRIGLAVDTGLSYYLPRVVGLRRARQLAMSGAQLNAEAALADGVVSRVLADNQLEEEAATLISRLASGAAIAMAESKRLLRESLDADIATQVEREALAVGRCAASEDFVEGVSAFLARRTPRFVGR